MDEHLHMTDRELRDQIIDRNVFDEAFYDDDRDDDRGDVAGVWPQGWWIWPAVVICLLFWLGVTIATWIWLLGIL